MRVSVDDRRLAYCDIFPDAKMGGELNVVVLAPGALLAWHRHLNHSDFLFCIKGAVKVGWEVHLVGQPRQEPHFTVLHERDQQAFAILPTLWHGYMNVSEGESILLCYVNGPYDPDDEERRVPDENEWKRVAR